LSTLYLITTPIGNLEDVTHRALRVLGEIDALACEDTRRTARLLERHEVDRPTTVFSYHEHNEERAGRRILELLDAGRSVGLCTNAGCPGISDPGYRVVRDALAGGHEVEAVPGASAVHVALVTSGLPTSSYVFRGFPPKKPGQRRRFLAEEADRPHTQVFFESPHRIGRFLADAFEVLGDRAAAVCIELTKKFERVSRGTLAGLADEFREKKVKGEVTVVIAGNNPKFTGQGTEAGAS